MGNVTSSCHQPTTQCCRWTADDDGELSVEGRGRTTKAAEEEPRMNFDTNVIGPTNANIIGGGTSLQELKFLEERTFPKDWQARDHAPERTSKDRDLRAQTAAELKKAAKAMQPKASAKGGGLPVSAKAKPKMDPTMSSVASSSVLPFGKSPAKAQVAPPQKEAATEVAKEKVVHSTKPNMAGDMRTIPSASLAKLYAAFPSGREETKPEPLVEKASAPSPSPSPVLRASQSLAPALWSPIHRRWTCQCASEPLPTQAAEAPREVEPTEAVVEFPAAAVEAPSAHVEPVDVAEAEKPQLPQASAALLRLCSTAPALWSPLHRKWCGQVLKMQLAEVPTLLVKKAMPPKALPAESCVEPMPAKEAKPVEEAVTQKEIAEATSVPLVMPKALKATEPPRRQVGCSSMPALYSKWHGRWTGPVPEPSKLGA